MKEQAGPGLIEHFEHLSEAPGAMGEIRRLILDLAVRGKLVSQDAGDEPAGVLLKRIAAEKARLVKEGRIKKEPAPPTIEIEELPCQLPIGWEWVRLGTLSELVTSGSRDWAQFYSSSGAIFVRMGNLSRGSYNLRLDNIQYVSPPSDGEGTRTKLAEGDILISITGEVGLLGLIPKDFGEAYINQHTCLVRPVTEMRNRYLPEFFRSPIASQQFDAPQRGIKNSFRLTDVTNLLIPLPPLAEQKRIVAKVDQLMALCDRLEAAQTVREYIRDRLAKASLQQLNTESETKNAPTFKDQARFFIQHLPRISTRPEHIGGLRQAILNLAVRGKLVSQDAGDEPAGVLLKRIAAEKARLVKEGRIKKGKASSQPLDEAPPFTIPKNWTWTQLAEIGQVNPRNDAPDDIQASFVPMPLISAEYGVANRHEVRAWGDIKIGYTHFAEGDVGLAKITPCFENGKSTVFRGLTGGIGAGTTELHIVRPIIVTQDYILIFLKSPFFVDRGTSRMTGTAGQKRVPTEYFAHSPFPLPPLAEQKRIVAKVDQLMALCDQLEQQITTSQTKHISLLKAILQHINTPKP